MGKDLLIKNNFTTKHFLTGDRIFGINSFVEGERMNSRNDPNYVEGDPLYSHSFKLHAHSAAIHLDSTRLYSQRPV